MSKRNLVVPKLVASRNLFAVGNLVVLNLAHFAISARNLVAKVLIFLNGFLINHFRSLFPKFQFRKLLFLKFLFLKLQFLNQDNL